MPNALGEMSQIGVTQRLAGLQKKEMMLLAIVRMPKVPNPFIGKCKHAEQLY